MFDLPPPLITVSIVSHGQGDLLRPLLEQLAGLRMGRSLQVIVTENLGASSLRRHDNLSLELEYIVNPDPKGFGENHNAAFARAGGKYFCVMNPDIRLKGNPIGVLVAQLKQAQGVAGPRVISPIGTLEDSARCVPTVQRLIARHFFRTRRADYAADSTKNVDWMAGMCLMFDADAYRSLGGFDERFHLYCEDVDICLRAHLLGWSVSWTVGALVEHDARRDSRRKPKYLWWHLCSMVRLFTSPTYQNFRAKNPHIPR